MVKTGIQHALTNPTQTDPTRPERTTGAQSPHEAGADRAGSNPAAEQRAQSETLDVARARAVYARTQEAVREAPSGAIQDSQEAKLRAEQFAEQLRNDPKQAVEAQTGQLTSHLVDLL